MINRVAVFQRHMVSSYFRDSDWVADIMNHLNSLNVQRQGELSS